MSENPAPKECTEEGLSSGSRSIPSKTGTYAFRNGVVVKISDDVPSVATDVSLGGKEGYMDEHLGDWNEKKQVYEPYHVTSKKDKKRRMKELGLEEKGGKDVKPRGKVQYHDMGAEHATVFTGRK